MDDPRSRAVRLRSPVAADVRHVHAHWGGEAALAPAALLVVVSLGFSKGGKRQGAEDFVLTDDSVVYRYLAPTCRGLEPHQRILRGEACRFRNAFQKAVEAMGQSCHQFRPYSVRRGGASEALGRTGQLKIVMEMGRWNDIKTARVYLARAPMEIIESG